MRALLVLALIPACGFHPAAPGDGGVRDTADRDATGGEPLPGSEPLPAGCYGTAYITVCPKVMPTSPLHIGNRHVHTDATSPDCLALDPDVPVCVLAGSDVQVSNFLSAEGPRPLVVLSLSTLDVNGTIDVASHRDLSPQATGAAADVDACGGTPAVTSTGGGFGGSFGSQGGNGGTTGPSGLAGPAITPTTLRGGCAGGIGKDFIVNNTGGRGGGAVQLIALTSITVLGDINASGSSGGGANPTNNGGGGGGSGGMIVFDAPLLTFDAAAQVYANGGGGGGGSSDNGVAIASNGGDASGFNSGTGGGTGIPGLTATSPNGALGGDGAVFSAGAIAGHDGTSGGGNGGGGGGYGIVRVLQAPIPTTGRVSPPAV